MIASASLALALAASTTTTTQIKDEYSSTVDAVQYTGIMNER